MKYQWSWIVSLLFAIVITIFAIMNMNPVRVNFGFGAVQFPLVLVILGSALVGAIVSGFYALYKHFELKRTTRQQKEHIEQLEREVKKYRYHDKVVDTPIIETVDEAEGIEQQYDVMHNRKDDSV